MREPKALSQTDAVLCAAADCVSRARLSKLGTATDLAMLSISEGCLKTVFNMLIVSRKACDD